jgi:hypothetical protein
MHQNRAILAVMFCGLLVIDNRTIGAQPLTSQKYQQVKPLLEKVDLGKLKINNHFRLNDSSGNNCAVVRPNFCIAIGRDLNTSSSDHGIQLFLIEKAAGELKIRYQSKGSGDAYNLSPSFYRHPNNGSWVILAESGTEYSWGVRVFTINQDRVVNVGDLNVAVGGVLDNSSSVVPYTMVSQEGVNMVFRFTRDVVTDPGGNNTQYIAKNKIHYTYDGQVFQEIIASEPNQIVAQKREFPDRINSSRKIRGKFLRKVWGDYLYITVSTKSGEKVFLIDGNEDCFLIQNRTEQLAIDYDVLDRYTPQMGGYRRVNVIRNITSRKTNLKKWRRTVTQKEQDQCE